MSGPADTLGDVPTRDAPSRSPRELARFLRAALVTPVPRDHEQSRAAFRRRRIVALVTLLVGSTVLALSFSSGQGSTTFYLLTGLLALTWTAGALISGPLHLGWAHTRGGQRHARPVVQPIAFGVLIVAVFCAGAVLIAQVPLLLDAVNDVLDYARFASLPIVALITLVNGVAEELFFRGALFAAIGRRHPVLLSTVLYTLVTLATLNIMLVFAAAVLGVLVGLQRRVTGGILAPIITHLIWSLSLLFLLPPILDAFS